MRPSAINDGVVFRLFDAIQSNKGSSMLPSATNRDNETEGQANNDSKIFKGLWYELVLSCASMTDLKC